MPSSVKMRGRSNDDSQYRRMLLSVCGSIIVLVLLSVYYSSFLSSRFRHIPADRDDRDDNDLRKLSKIRHRTSGSDEVDVILEKSTEEDMHTEDDQSEQYEISGNGHDKREVSEEEDIDDVTVKSFPVCDERYTEIIPCLDRNMLAYMKIKPNYTLMEHYERHCPPPQRRLNCLIPAPPNYKLPVKWPASRDQVWRANVPHTFLASQKSDQHWMVVKGDKVIFPGGGTHFHDGADKYIAILGKMLGNADGDLSSKGKIRTVLDVGCGVASFGAYLLPLNILTMSIAPNDVHENQIQFALERGIPSTLGVLGTMRLPFPSKSFELAHCSRCRIDWSERDGILLLEVDRLLRVGGYFVWSSPAAYRNDEVDRKEWMLMTSLTQRMCWSIAAKEGQTVIWSKPTTNHCYKKHSSSSPPPIPVCSSSDDPDAAWQVKMKPCIFPLSQYEDDVEGSGLLAWPKRLIIPPPSLKYVEISENEFHRDTAAWRERVNLYWKQVEMMHKGIHIRNIMDMKAHLGGFAAALKNKEVWVMNVVPSYGLNTLKIVYDRGLIGSMHNWCEAYSTYPRTYDMLHAWGVMSEVVSQGCSVEDVLLEMDRLLRPMGVVIIRDGKTMVTKISKYISALHWEQFENNNKNKTLEEEEEMLFLRKKLWQPHQL